MDDEADRGQSRAPELEDLVTLCRALQREGVRYALIGGFAVILHGYVRATKDIDLLIDPSIENIQALKRAMADLPDNAIALMEDDEVGKYSVIRIADEIVVGLMKEACGVDYEDALTAGLDVFELEGVEIPLARKQTLVRTKDTVRPSDAADVGFLKLAIEREGGSIADCRQDALTERDAVPLVLSDLARVQGARRHGHRGRQIREWRAILLVWAGLVRPRREATICSKPVWPIPSTNRARA